MTAATTDETTEETDEKTGATAAEHGRASDRTRNQAVAQTADSPLSVPSMIGKDDAPERVFDERSEHLRPGRPRSGCLRFTHRQVHGERMCERRFAQLSS